jgi:starch-binding outer membrane protein, SusD/RagB family
LILKLKKIMRIIKITIAGLLALSLGSCKKTVEGFDKDPNRSVSTSANFLLDAAQVGSILIYEGNLARTASVWSRSTTGVDRQYVSINNYNTSSGDYDSEWDNLFQGVITQFKLAEDAALPVNNKKVAGIAEIGMAQGFGLAADLWGDVPFSEVGDPVKFPAPKFEPQATVYAGVQALLDKGIANLQANVGLSPGSKDVFYGGDAAKWIKAAYTLKARFYLHTKEYDKALAAAAQGINSASGSMYAPHGQTYLADFQVWYSFLTYDRPGYINADATYSVSILDNTSAKYRGNAKTNESARFNYLYQAGLNTGGMDPNVLCDFDWGVPADETGFFGANEAFPIVTYQENLLIQAEANMKKATPDITSALAALNAYRAYLANPATTYIRSGYFPKGIKYDPYVIADFSPGGIANPTTLSQQEALLIEILEERYVTFIGQIEEFNDVRRTKNKLGIPPVTGTKLPQRYLYPQSEINTNPNTPKLASGDLFKETPVNTTPY